MSKHYYNRSSRNIYDEPIDQRDQSSSINFDNPIDLDDENEVATENEVVINEPVRVSTNEAIATPKDKKDESMIGVINTLSNMRKAPSLDSDVLTVITEGTKVKVLDRGLEINRFYHIKYNGLDGYILNILCDIGA